MHILLTVLHTFLMELVRRICLNIKTSYPWWSLPLFSSLECWKSSDNVKRNFIFVTGQTASTSPNIHEYNLAVNLRPGSIFVSLGETFRREGRNEKIEPDTILLRNVCHPLFDWLTFNETANQNFFCLHDLRYADFP